jgi:hypothetical protein
MSTHVDAADEPDEEDRRNLTERLLDLNDPDLNDPDLNDPDLNDDRPSSQ